MSQRGFFGRRIQGLQRVWQAIAGSEYDEEAASLRPELPEEDRPRLFRRMRQCLEARGGEVTARSQAAALGRVYLALNEAGRLEFLRMLAREFDLDPQAVGKALRALRGADTAQDRREARLALMKATESPRTRILTRFNALPEGVKFLVDLRADLLPLAREDPLLASLDDDLRALLGSWFDVDFLQLRRISWQTASGALLEKFMAYEAVHPVESWEDLKNRLDQDRRYFAFFHPRMPEEPLIFLEVALVQGMAGNIQELLDPEKPVGDPNQADTAIFYSISNAQKGLAGIAFGGFLIKRVVDELAAEFPALDTFATLSPLPGFWGWLKRVLVEEDVDDLLLSSEAKRLREFVGGKNPAPWIAGVLQKAQWQKDDGLEGAVRPVFLRLAARYLKEAKRPGGGALDPVAHFHLSNGARIQNLNWAGDTSRRGLEQSGGIMVNYLYDSRKIEGNHEAYKGRGEVSISASIRGLLKS